MIGAGTVAADVTGAVHAVIGVAVAVAVIVAVVRRKKTSSAEDDDLTNIRHEQRSSLFGDIFHFGGESVYGATSLTAQTKQKEKENT